MTTKDVPTLNPNEEGKTPPGQGPPECVALDSTIQDLRNQLQSVWAMLAHERHRTDILLARSEGVLEEIGQFHEVWRSELHQKPFNATKPLISVLIAKMGECDLLIDRCIKSIRAQSYDNLQRGEAYGCGKLPTDRGA